MSLLKDLLNKGPVVVAVGARDFATSLRAQDVRVVEVDWRPPYKPDQGVQAVLEKLL